MRVFLKAIGDLRDYFGRDTEIIELPDGAVAQDLLNAIQERWGASLPAYLWNQDTRQFKGPVLMVFDKKAIRDLAFPMVDGMEINLFRAVAGG